VLGCKCKEGYIVQIRQVYLKNIFIYTQYFIIAKKIQLFLHIIYKKMQK